jgi:hypothetical protein
VRGWIWTAGLLAALVPATARADVVDDAFARGNEAAAAGDLQAAVRHYEEAERLLPGRSAVLSFNLGTAYAQLGELGLATHHLRRALQAQARASADVSEAAQRNLGIVRRGRKWRRRPTGRRSIGRRRGETPCSRPSARRSSGGWLLGQVGWRSRCGCCAGAWADAPGRGDHQRHRRAGGDLPGGRALHGYAVRSEAEAPQATVVAAKLEVREGPGSHRKVMFVVQGGSRVRVVDRGAGWLRIRLPDGLEGWAPQADLRTSTEVPRRPQGSG